MVIFGLTINFKKIPWICSVMGGHDWTNAADQGINPSPEQLKNGFDGFMAYSNMYCKQCGYESDLVKKLK